MIKSTLITGLLFFSFQLLAQRITLKEAISNKKIEYSISGSWNSDDPEDFQDADGQYFGKCMMLQMKNKTHDTLHLVIENGLMLICDDTSTQDMINTKPIYVDLYPRAMKKLQLYSMCTEIHDGMPSQSVNYKVGNLADKNLLAIVNAIEERFMQNIVGQGAVWAYTDQATEEELRTYGADDSSLKMTIEVLNMAQVITGLNPPQEKATAGAKDDISETGISETDMRNLEDESVKLNKNLLYCILAFLLTLFSLLLYFLFRKRNKRTKPSPDQHNERSNH